MLTSVELLKRFQKNSADLCGWPHRDSNSDMIGVAGRSSANMSRLSTRCMIATLLQVSMTVAVWFPSRDESEEPAVQQIIHMRMEFARHVLSRSDAAGCGEQTNTCACEKVRGSL